MNVNLIALFQIERFDNGGWKTNGKAISPARNLHNRLFDILYIKNIKRGKVTSNGNQ